MKPKVSVIIPAYNSEKYLAEAIESVFAQTYPGYEVIVVDDGSTDGTLQLLKRYDSRIKVLTKVNGGPASARNLAINNSCGEYIAFLDSDDLWVEEKLEEQVAFLNKHPEVGLVFGEILIFEERGGKNIILSKNGWTGDPTFRQLLFGNYIPNSTVVIRRRCVDEVGLLNESAELIAVEDHEYWMRIARTFPMAGIPNPLAYYRIREGNILGAGNGYDIDKGLKLALAAIGEAEKQFPQMWEECQVDRDLLFARLHIRAGFAWKKRGNWKECMLRFAKAVNLSRNPRVFRWILAATLLSRWS